MFLVLLDLHLITAALPRILAHKTHKPSLLFFEEDTVPILPPDSLSNGTIIKPTIIQHLIA